MIFPMRFLLLIWAIRKSARILPCNLNCAIRDKCDTAYQIQKIQTISRWLYDTNLTLSVEVQLDDSKNVVDNGTILTMFFLSLSYRYMLSCIFQVSCKAMFAISIQ